MKHFVNEDSIVREIWGKSDTVLFIFAGAAAEFALNKAVDWLYFTGRLPADPLGRLFSTVAYSQRIIFSTNEAAYAAIDQITSIHKQVEISRAAQIPDWAYRDVLFMLIDYSIRAYELLERKLTSAEKEDIFNVFHTVGMRMQLKDLPANYHNWTIARDIHLKEDLRYSDFTDDLFKKYREHLGVMRYWLLKKIQALITPKLVKELLSLRNANVWLPVLYLYKLSSIIKLQSWLRDLLLPVKYKTQIKQLNAY
ncbi:hypothetical protein SAMN05428988_3609 [Chitinophaga sp. YR573]|uniref:oxygenase MpaB family protein n=1 Tax=Chitinophaga sp. YR573 TaxID=1881040 RepID=UPI0008C9AEED|nr:oxygenase MpaB family protein [Chitinophaga sp. YR573]SEW25183.1 hypothetical protein SAMN05428988_3609 [Chitinophaga sp. YR573]